jgi:hypothetical protein
MTRIILNRPHTHAGRTLAPGDRVELPSDLADWLVAEGVARLDDESAGSEPAKTEPDPKPSHRSPTSLSSRPETSA